MPHRFSYKRYGQCLIFLLYLYFTGRLKALIVRLDGNKTWWPHFIGFTNKNHMIHLTNRKEEKGQNWTPICFYGRPEVFKRKSLRKAKYEVLLGRFCKDEYCMV